LDRPPQAIQLSCYRSYEFIYKTRFAIRACCEIRDEPQAVLRQRPHGDAVLGDTPCASSIEECQAFVYRNQLNCFLGTCDVVVMVASPAVEGAAIK
jgi:hypothetical protein